jgi:DNA polymerase-3 subunit delta'
MERCVWDDIVGQRDVASFLRTAASAQRVSHAYLFVGPPGSGKKTAALSLACALMCDDGGCGACGQCARVRRGAHPDVHVVDPEGAVGYMVEQVRDLVHDISLSPVEGPWKVYVITAADVLNESSANAFLKTLEEPPFGSVIVLLAHAYDAVPATIASRCQIVRFRRIPPSEAIALLRESTAASAEDAAAALAAAGGVMTRARDFLESSSRRAARDTILRALKDLSVMDELDVLDAARELLVAVRAPVEEAREVLAAEAADHADYLDAKATRSLEERQRRQLTAREREGIAEVLNVAESWLRDCLVISQGLPDLVANSDAADAMEEVGAVITPVAASRGLDSVNVARRRISYNVSPQLAIEALLFDIREVLRCPR